MGVVNELGISITRSSYELYLQQKQETEDAVFEDVQSKKDIIAILNNAKDSIAQLIKDEDSLKEIHAHFDTLITKIDQNV